MERNSFSLKRSILVGQKGVGPCDQAATRVEDLVVCQSPPTNLTEVVGC